jgi:hypothetical protein
MVATATKDASQLSEGISVADVEILIDNARRDVDRKPDNIPTLNISPLSEDKSVPAIRNHSACRDVALRSDAMSTDNASQLSADNSIPANCQNIWQSIHDWWAAREDAQHLYKETKDVQRLLFHKRKHVVPEDLWIPGAAPPGEKQHVTTIVSKQYVLSQLYKVIRKREEWLNQNTLPMNFHIRQVHQIRFLQHVKARYHAKPNQVKLQARDAKVSKYKVIRGKHTRWEREMQRRCGSKMLWEIISFTGKFSAQYFTESIPESTAVVCQTWCVKCVRSGAANPSCL